MISNLNRNVFTINSKMYTSTHRKVINIFVAGRIMNGRCRGRWCAHEYLYMNLFSKVIYLIMKSKYFIRKSRLIYNDMAIITAAELDETKKKKETHTERDTVCVCGSFWANCFFFLRSCCLLLPIQYPHNLHKIIRLYAGSFSSK